MAKGTTYSARYCVMCGGLLQKVGTKWKCPRHGTLDDDNLVTTTKPDK